MWAVFQKLCRDVGASKASKKLAFYLYLKNTQK